MGEDQLLIEKINGKFPTDFFEGAIKFPPTYKLHTDKNDFCKELKNFRMPGWTDRIL